MAMMLGLVACTSEHEDASVALSPAATLDQTATVAAQIIKAALVATPSPDSQATATAETVHLATALAATQTAQPTVAPIATSALDLAASATAQAAQIATGIVATLAAQSTPPPAISPVLQPGDLGRNPVDQATIVYIPGGEFTMGMSDEQRGYLLSLCSSCKGNEFDSSKPVHHVQVDAFWIYQTEVTNQLYAQCVNTGACKAPTQKGSETRADYWGIAAYADYPVIYVDWFAADQYCHWAGGRLPTEAEWEKAARGTDGRLFPWGNTPPDANLANIKRPIRDTVAVGSYPQGNSPYGVQDMAGNVWEWVGDWYAADYYASSEDKNPLGPAHSFEGRRSGRGGSWYWERAFASSAYHDWWEPGENGSGVGFRCVSHPAKGISR